jgi:hypothetical protein
MNESLSKYQSFTTKKVHRSQLKGAEYNPRYMPAAAKVKLKETLAIHGLVQPIVWNKRTGNIVGGHQRITQLDSLEKSSDYSLTVAVVDVDEKTERELNLLLNNPAVCGEWDLPKLQTLLNEVEMIKTGFDDGEFMRLFGTAPSQPDASQQVELNAKLAEVKDAYNKLWQANRTKDDTDFYNVVVFGSYGDRLEFLKEFGFEDNRYIDGRTLLQVMRHIKVEKAEATGTGEEPAQPGI